jgi:4-amino-4-deoxy-L-arabinose transferase-like glycosyltransferase
MKGWRSVLVDHLIGLLLGAAFVVVLVLSAGGLGYARDEGFYFQASTAYAGWFEQLLRAPSEAIARGAVDAAWGANHEHPALVKSVFSLSWLLLYKKWHLFAEEGTSFRFGGMLFAGIGVWLLYLWGTRARSRAAGLVAALSFVTMPRVFYHSHLDCFDVPITVMWFFCAYVYWRALGTGKVAWAIATGIVFGLALDTKHNAWFLPFALTVHAIIAKRDTIVRGLKKGYLAVPSPLLAMAILGPAVFVGLWPWLWFDTLDRLQGYFRFHLNHDYYNIIYLGQTYFRPPFPFSYVWVMTAATVPTITLVLFAIGLCAVLLRRARIGRLPFPVPLLRRDDVLCTGWLWAIGIATQYAPWILSRGTPIFGATKHWMPAYPFLCLFAGVGFVVVWEKLRAYLAARVAARWSGVRAEALLGVCVLAAPLAETVHSHPWGLSNYTPLVGGASGAASLGLNRQFWGFTTGAVTDFLNDHVKASQSVFLHDTAWPSWDMLQRDGRLLPHVRAAGAIEQSDWAVYHHEEHMEGVEYQIWGVYGTATPAHVATYDGVPIIWVFEKRRGR